MILIFKNEKLNSLTLLGEINSSVLKASVGEGLIKVSVTSYSNQYFFLLLLGDVSAQKSTLLACQHIRE